MAGAPAGYEEVAAPSSSGPPKGYAEVAPPPNGVGGSFDDSTKWTPGTGEKVVGAVTGMKPDEELTHTIAQSFDLAHLGKNLYSGTVGVAQFAHGLGKDLIQNPNWVLGEHSVYDKYISDPASAEFQKSIAAGRAGKYSEAAGHGLAGALPLIGPFAAALGEQAGTGDVGGAAAKGVGGYIGGKALEMAAKAPSEVYTTARDFANRSSSLDAISTNASAVHKQAIQHIQTGIESLKAEGIRTIQEAVQADQTASKSGGMRGTISSTPIVTEGMRAMEDVGYQAVPKPIQAAISRVAAGPTNLTLEEAVKLRTAFGDAAQKAQGNPKAYYVLNAAREELNPLIEKRFGELGQAPAWNYYNKKFKAAYDIQDSFKDVLESSANRYDSIGSIEKFSKMNLTELQREMKNQGLTQQAKQLDTIKTDAGRITEAHDILSKKMGLGLTRMALADPKAAALGIAAYQASAGSIVHGIGGYLLGTIMANAIRRMQAAMDMGRLGKQYPNPMETVVDSGPKQSFKFSSPPAPAAGGGGDSTPISPAVPSTVGSVAGAKADTGFFAEAKAKLGPDASLSQIASEAQRMKEMNKRGMPYKQSASSKADTIQRIKKANRGEVESEGEMARRGGSEAPSKEPPKDTKLSLSDWEKSKEIEGIQERRGAAKKDAEKSSYTPEQQTKLDTAKKTSEGTRAMWKQSLTNDPEMLGKKLKGEGFRHAAEKRQITGELTGKEQKAKAMKEASAYKGKSVKVGGKSGTVIGTTFGKIRVKFEDGAIKSIASEDLE